MDRSHTRKLDEILREYLSQIPSGEKYREMALLNRWEELVGKTIARQTRKIQLKKGKLIIELNSSVVRNELFLIREELRARLNELAGEELVREIVLK